MSQPDTDELARWAAAEQAGSWNEADAWFAAVALRHLPRAAEPAWLATRIMAALPRTTRAGRFRAVLDLANSWWVHATVAAAVGVLGVALAAVSPGQLLAFSTSGVEAFARLAHTVSASFDATLGVLGATWTLLIDLGTAALVVATSGPAPALIGANLLLACLAFAGLSRLLSAREECY